MQKSRSLFDENSPSEKEQQDELTNLIFITLPKWIDKIGGHSFNSHR